MVPAGEMCGVVGQGRATTRWVWGCLLFAGLMAPCSAAGYALDHLRTTDDIGPDKVPHRGTSHILVVPMRVGMNRFPVMRLDALRRFFDPAGGPKTFRGYWLAVSRGEYDPIPTLVEPVMYPDTCPIPGKSLRDCTVSPTDLQLLTGGAIQAVFGGVLERVRDEQRIDLSHFDVNTADGPGQDGYFDGLIVDTNVLAGVGMPLNAMRNAVEVSVTPRAPGATNPGAADGPDSSVDAGVEADAPVDLFDAQGGADAGATDPGAADGPDSWVDAGVEADAPVDLFDAQGGADAGADLFDVHVGADARAENLDSAADALDLDLDSGVEADALAEGHDSDVGADTRTSVLDAEAAADVPGPGDGRVDGGTDAHTATLIAGNVALIPPENHEFGHILGFIDLYGGPPINDVMGEDSDATLGAFSRLQIGWGEAIEVKGPGTFILEPVMESGQVLRIGEPPRYLLVENRDGPLHRAWDSSLPGVYIYSVDEDTLPTTALGFLDIRAGDLYYPNAEPPYLNVNLPVGCWMRRAHAQKGCMIWAPGTVRPLVHASGESTDLRLRIEERLEGQAVRIRLLSDDEPAVVDAGGTGRDAGPESDRSVPVARDGAHFADADPPARLDSSGGDGCGCRMTDRPEGGAVLLLLLLLPWMRSRAGRRQSPR